MDRPYFITGIGTGIGKTLVSAVLCHAWQADYWKPVQAGWEEGTDSQWISRMAPAGTQVFEEAFRLKKPASPHIAAREEGIDIRVADLVAACPSSPGPLLIEGAGGLLVPLNEKETMADLALALQARLVLVSRNYLGSINHSLLTAAYCRQAGLDVAGWIFNDRFGDYEKEIAAWTGYPILGSIPFEENPGEAFLRRVAGTITKPLS